MRKKQHREHNTKLLKIIISNVLLLVTVAVTVALVVQHEVSKNIIEITEEQELAVNSNEDLAGMLETESIELSEESITLYATRQKQLSVIGTEHEVIWKSSDEKVATVSTDGTVTGQKKGDATITATVGEQTVSCKVKIKKIKQVALTFDDGPGKYTPTVLDALETYNAKATFFVVGQNITDTTMPYLTRAGELGCEIGSHTYSHIRLTKSSKKKIDSEIKKTDDLIKQATGKKASIIRPPYGEVNEKVLSQINKAQILWNVDTEDWRYKDTDRLINYVIKNAEDGDVILMHDIHESTALAIEDIVKGLYEKGFEMVTVSELANAKGVSLSAHEKYSSFK